MKYQLIPTILEKDSLTAKERLLKLQRIFNYIQIDVLDNSFVKETSFFDVSLVRKWKPKCFFEFHCMVNNPSVIFKKISGWKNARKIIIHYEAFSRDKRALYDIIEEIRLLKKEVGLAINPNTPVAKVIEFIPRIDEILIMGVIPGKSGQKFDSSVLEKIKSLRSKFSDLNIGVDGGVNEENLERILEAGASKINAHSFIDKYLDNPKKLKELKNFVATYHARKAKNKKSKVVRKKS